MLRTPFSTSFIFSTHFENCTWRNSSGQNRVKFVSYIPSIIFCSYVSSVRFYWSTWKVNEFRQVIAIFHLCATVGSWGAPLVGSWYLVRVCSVGRSVVWPTLWPNRNLTALRYDATHANNRQSDRQRHRPLQRRIRLEDKNEVFWKCCSRWNFEDVKEKDQVREPRPEQKNIQLYFRLARSLRNTRARAWIKPLKTSSSGPQESRVILRGDSRTLQQTILFSTFHFVSLRRRVKVSSPFLYTAHTTSGTDEVCLLFCKTWAYYLFQQILLRCPTVKNCFPAQA